MRGSFQYICLLITSLLLSLTVCEKSVTYPINNIRSSEKNLAQAGNQTPEQRITDAVYLNQEGYDLYQRGETKSALDKYNQALVIFRQVGARAGEGNSLNFIGEVYLTLGENDEAAIRNNLATLYFSIGQYDQALDFSQQASVIYQKNLGRDYQGLKPQDFQLLHDILGKSSLNSTFVHQSLAIRAGVGNAFSAESMVRQGEAVNLNNLGQIYSNQGDNKQALNLYQQALSIYKEIDNSLGVAITLNNIAQIVSNLGQYDQAVSFNQQALAIYQKVKDKAGIGVTLTNIGQIYQKQGKFTESLDSLNQALVIQKAIGDRASIAITLRIIALNQLQTNKINEGILNLTQSLKVIESLRPGLNDASKISMFESQNISYKLLEKALIIHKQPNQALEVSERGRARAFVELLAQRLANEETPNSSSKQATIKPPTIAEIQKIAAVKKATLVEYSLNSDQELYIWVIKPTGEITFRKVELNAFKNTANKEQISSLDIKKLVIDARNSLFFPVASRSKSKFEELHQLLIQPIADLLPTNPQDLVIFIPQQSLFLLPFSALIDADGKYLIEKHTILTAPSIQVLDLTHQQKQKNQQINPQNTLIVGIPRHSVIVGNPTMPSLPPKLGELPVRLNALPGAELEAEAVAQVLKNPAIIGNQATKQAVVQQMLNSRIIHLATHGLLDDIGKKGLLGAIALAPFNNDDGLLTASEILNLKLNADLVVLSACNTGRGRITGDGVVGLSRSFISAGTSSIIVSLWAIPDDSTAVLMPEFYTQLQQNSNKAEALRQAMLITMKKYPNPKDWAAFTLIGEAQ